MPPSHFPRDDRNVRRTSVFRLQQLEPLGLYRAILVEGRVRRHLWRPSMVQTANTVFTQQRGTLTALNTRKFACLRSQHRFYTQRIIFFVTASRTTTTTATKALKQAGYRTHCGEWSFKPPTRVFLLKKMGPPVRMKSGQRRSFSTSRQRNQRFVGGGRELDMLCIDVQ